MSNINSITGDRIVTKPSDSYAEGYDRIWGNKKEEPKSYSKPIILSNKIQCKVCGDIIESKHVHDYVTCSCGSVSADGGKDYLKRTGFSEDYLDLSEVTSENEEDWFEKVRETFTWSSRGKLGNEPLHQILLKDLTDEHLKSVIDTQWHIKGSYVEEYMKKELEYRGIDYET